MTHIANQRIKQNGKYITAGNPITLTEDELRDLPKGAASIAPEVVNDQLHEFVSDLTEEQVGKLAGAVANLPDEHFKKDGDIRKDSLATLIEALGFDVTAEDVAAAKPTLGTE